MNRKTIFSHDRVYRYTLWREWGDLHGLFSDGPNNFLGTPETYVNFICLNPSTADETKDDPTIRRCRKCIGIELNPEYIEIARRRCNVTPGLAL